MTTTKTIGSETYTLTEDGSYRDARGGEWIDERRDVRSKIRYNERQAVNSEDASEVEMYRNLIAEDREDLAIMTALFGK